jgi:photosystem II stability/assembly factor-like uncharacterized protein
MHRAIRLAALAACFVSGLGCSGSGNGGPDASMNMTDAGNDGGTVDAGGPVTYLGWDLLDGGPTIAGKMDDVFFLDETTGWSVDGQDGRIYKTTDSGQSWAKVLEQAGTYFRAIVFFDEMRGFAANIGTDYFPGVTDTTPLYLTTNGGTTWAPVTTFDGPTPNGICNFSLVDDQHVFATGRVGGPAFFLASADQGATWKSTNLSPADGGYAEPDGGVGTDFKMLVDSHFFNTSEGLITGGSTLDGLSRCVILRTEDSGATWSNVFTSGGQGEMCWKMSFPSDVIGYAAVLTFGNQKSTIVKTSDGGKTWVEFGFTGTNFAGLGVGFINETTGWVGGYSNDTKAPVAYRTDDGAQTWTPETTLGPYINRFRFIGDNVGYAIGSSIFKLKVQQ